MSDTCSSVSSSIAKAVPVRIVISIRCQESTSILKRVKKKVKLDLDILLPMDTCSPDEPLITSVDVEPDYVKRTPLWLSLSKCVLKSVMWAVFIALVALIFLYPTEFAQGLYQKWIQALNGSVFGITGSLLLTFSGPILIIAFLSIIYLIASGEEDFNENKKPKYPSFRLWTFPILVDGPFGVVSATELIGILLFTVYVLWAISIYAMNAFNEISNFHLPSKEKSFLMLEIMGLRLGSIGLFCLAFLFLPIARGSVLLRVIDIPFDHATRYHVWLGHLTMMIFTLHGVCYIVVWAMQGNLLHELMEWKNIGIANLPGVISLLAGLLMWVTSLNPVRKQYFELFFYTHQLYMVFVIFLALHVSDFIFSITAGGIFLFLLDRFLRFWQSRQNVDVISTTCLPCGTVELVLSKPPKLILVIIQLVSLFSFVILHSVSSSPLVGRYHLSVLIKVLGQWTDKLRGTISNIPEEEESQKDLTIHPYSRITASVEGPYGHESPYHLMYENLILVAGGIGISPFVAILSDILYRIKDREPCRPRNVLVVWAMKRTKELSLLSAIDMDSTCPSFCDKLHLEIQTYVTRESESPLEEGILDKTINSQIFPIVNGNSMSGLVGTGNKIWSGVYVILSTVGFIILLGLMDRFYINRFGISSWWFKGLLFVVCMVASVVVFGGLVIILWHLWESRVSDEKKYMNDGEKGDSKQRHKPAKHANASQQNHVFSSTIHYGHRPDFKEIFKSISQHWGCVDVGVLVCGPSTLQSSVAKECRSKNIRRNRNQPIFHFNSHSFDL